MSERRPTEPSLRVALYLDGALEGDEREAFERELEGSPTLRAELEAMRRADGSLTRVFGGLEAVEPDLSPASLPLRRRPAVRNAVAGAAVLAAVLFLAVSVWPTLFPAQRKPTRFSSMAQVYREYERRGWPIDWVCETDAEFARATAVGVGVAMVVEAAPGLELSGWSYADYLSDLGIGGRAMILIAEVDGESSLVVVEPGTGPRFEPGARDGLRVFRRELEGVTLHEVTPRVEAGVIGRFRVVEGDRAE